MDQELCYLAIREANRQGAQYAEARLQGEEELGAILRNGAPEPAIMGDYRGLGIRILNNGALAFASTNRPTAEAVRKLVREAAKRAKSLAPMFRKKEALSVERTEKVKWSGEEKKKLEHVEFANILEMLRDVDGLLSKPVADVSFPNRLLIATTSIETKLIVTNDGREVESRVPRVHFGALLTGSHEGKTTSFTLPSGYAQLGGCGGWEVFERVDPHKFILSVLPQIAKAIKADKKPPSGRVDLVLGPDVGGLACHESCGHPFEADRILGREAAQAGESYLKSGDMGRAVGGPEAYVSDDPTIGGSNGFYLYDDEGIKATKRKLLEAGVVRNLLHNRSTAYSFKTKSNGSSRATAYDREPIVRMSNTFIEPGDYNFEELLEGIKEGIYIASYMEWNIDDTRMNQRYVGLEAYEIKKGRLGDNVARPVLEITTNHFWRSIDARAGDLSFNCATCGKGDPMQGIPVWTGSPHIRLRGVRVGAR